MSRVVANAFTVMACGVLWTSAAMAAESHSTAADGGVAQVQDAGSASVSMPAAATAVADGAVSPRNLQDEIAELRAKMAEMESRHQNEMASLRAEYGDRWLTEQRAEEIRELVRDVIADAQSRASAKGQGATAGWDRHFFLASEDGKFKMQVRAQIQARWALSDQNMGTAADAAPGSPSEPTSSDNTWGFEFRRMKIDFSGYIIDPSWTYELQPIWNRFQTATATNGSLENVFIQKELADGLSVRVGQYKVPFNREEFVSSTVQLVIERSLASEMLTPKFSQGLMADWQTEHVRLRGFFGDALRANGSGVRVSGAGLDQGNAGPLANYNGGFNQPIGSNSVNYAMSTRGEWRIAGEWSQLRDMMATPDEDFGVLLGGAFMAQSLRQIPATSLANPVNPMKSMWAATGDLTIAFPGASIFAAGIYRRVNLVDSMMTRDGSMDDGMDQWSAIVQGGYFILNDLELYSRYEWGNSDSNKFRTFAGATSANGEELSILTVGLNWFPAGSKNRNLKWSADVGFGFTPIIDWANSGADWMVDYTNNNGGSNNGQVVIRTQMQLLF
jgi:hypothetical protein